MSGKQGELSPLSLEELKKTDTAISYGIKAAFLISVVFLLVGTSYFYINGERSGGARSGRVAAGKWGTANLFDGRHRAE